MPVNKTMPYYAITAVLFFLLKLFFSFAEVSALEFLLKPTDICIKLLTGFRSVYIPGSGYYYDSLNIIIDKSKPQSACYYQ